MISNILSACYAHTIEYLAIENEQLKKKLSACVEEAQKQAHAIKSTFGEENQQLLNQLQSREDEVKILKDQIERMQKPKNPASVEFIYCANCVAFVGRDKDLHKRVAELEERLKHSLAVKAQFMEENIRLRNKIEELERLLTNPVPAAPPPESPQDQCGELAPHNCDMHSHRFVVDKYVVKNYNIYAALICEACNIKKTLTDKEEA